MNAHVSYNNHSTKPSNYLIWLPLNISSSSGVARNFSQGVHNSNCLQFSTDTLHCFCREWNFDRRTRHHLPHFLNGNLTEVAEMHMANTRRRHIAGGSTHSFNFLDEELGSLLALMSVEADAGLCHVTRLMKISTRARGHVRFLIWMVRYCNYFAPFLR